MDELINLIDSLHEFEKKVLLEMKQPLTVEEVVEKSKMDYIKVMRGAQWLNNKGLIIIKEEKKELINITIRGKETISKGLPELRFLEKLIKKNNQSFNELKQVSKLDDNEFNKSVGFCRGKKLIEMNQGIISITKEGKKYYDEEESKTELLKVFEKKEQQLKSELKNKKDLDELIKRGLLTSETKIMRTLAATPKGLKLIKRKSDFNKKLLERNTPSIIKSKEWEKTGFRRYNVLEQVPKKYYGKKQPYVDFVNGIKQKLVSVGFVETKGPSIETNFFNCDALFMPQDHPARGIHDIFYIKEPENSDLKKYKEVIKKVKKIQEKGMNGSTGWGVGFDEEFTKKNILRSQGTAVSIRTLMNKDLKVPGKYFTIARAYRPDVIDKTHLPEFDQLDGIVIGKNMNLKTLFGLLRMFATEVAGIEKFKLMPDYYPYTEPSVSLHGYFNGKWVELGGAGIFRPEVTETLGIKQQVIAWGLGFGRMYMSKQGLKDIRDMFSSDINLLRNAKVMK